MKKATALKIINAILFVLILSQASSVAIMKLGLAQESIFEIHEFIGFGILITSSLHVWLNWNWIKANLLSKRPRIPTN